MSHTNGQPPDRERCILELRLLGQTTITGLPAPTRQTLLSQRKRFALLVYLLLGTPNGLVERNALLAMFWPELDERRARQALRRALHFLRSNVGSAVLPLTGRHTVGGDNAFVRCDVSILRNASASGDHAAALHVYGGPLLPGFELPGVPAFGRWLDAERSRSRALAYDAAMSLARTELAGGNPGAALAWSQKAEAIMPDEEDAVRTSMAILHDLGSGAAAVQKYEALATRLEDEYELRPAAQTRDLLARLREGAAGESARAAVNAPPPPPQPDSFETMLDSLPDAVVQTDLRGRIRYANREALAVTRRTRSDLLGMRLVDLVREDYRERITELLTAQLLDRQGMTQPEFPLCAEGDEVWLALRTRLVEHPGRAASLLSTVQDVTARRRADRTDRGAGSRDPLTGLPDRDGFQIILEERIRLAKRSGLDVVLFYVALEGEGPGDPGVCTSDYCQLQAARLLRTTFRDSDVVARVGESSFGVIAHAAEVDLMPVVQERLYRRWDALRRSGGWPEGVGIRLGSLRRASHGRALAELLDEPGGAAITDAAVWELLRRSARPLASPGPDRAFPTAVGALEE